MESLIGDFSYINTTLLQYCNRRLLCIHPGEFYKKRRKKTQREQRTYTVQYTVSYTETCAAHDMMHEAWAILGMAVLMHISDSMKSVRWKATATRECDKKRY